MNFDYFFESVKEMRGLQKKFFRTKDKSLLVLLKQTEKNVDRLIKTSDNDLQNGVEDE